MCTPGHDEDEELIMVMRVVVMRVVRMLMMALMTLVEATPISGPALI